MSRCRSAEAKLTWLRNMAEAHLLRGEFDAAIGFLERAARTGGPYRDLVLVDLEGVRRQRAVERGHDPVVPSEFREVFQPSSDAR
jgi:hypothetical protein